MPISLLSSNVSKATLTALFRQQLGEFLARERRLTELFDSTVKTLTTVTSTACLFLRHRLLRRQETRRDRRYCSHRSHCTLADPSHGIMLKGHQFLCQRKKQQGFVSVLVGPTWSTSSFDFSKKSIARYRFLNIVEKKRGKRVRSCHFFVKATVFRGDTCL